MGEAKKIVLVVDDNKDHRTIAAALLNYAGYIVLEAESVATAERLLNAHHPDLILLDISMPTKNGLEWALELRGEPETETLPIASYTSFRDVYVEELRQLNVSVIDKSDGPHQFLDRIETLFERCAGPDTDSALQRSA